jgi:hypothetical protein
VSNILSFILEPLRPVEPQQQYLRLAAFDPKWPVSRRPYHDIAGHQINAEKQTFLASAAGAGYDAEWKHG